MKTVKTILFLLGGIFLLTSSVFAQTGSSQAIMPDPTATKTLLKRRATLPKNPLTELRKTLRAYADIVGKEHFRDQDTLEEYGSGFFPILERFAKTINPNFVFNEDDKDTIPPPPPPCPITAQLPPPPGCYYSSTETDFYFFGNNSKCPKPKLVCPGPNLPPYPPPIGVDCNLPAALTAIANMRKVSSGLSAETFSPEARAEMGKYAKCYTQPPPYPPYPIIYPPPIGGATITYPYTFVSTGRVLDNKLALEGYCSAMAPGSGSPGTSLYTRAQAECVDKGFAWGGGGFPYNLGQTTSHIWNFKDGSIRNSQILSRTDQEYTNFIASKKTEALTGYFNGWEAGGGNQTIWREFGIPKISTIPVTSLNEPVYGTACGQYMVSTACTAAPGCAWAATYCYSTGIGGAGMGSGMMPGMSDWVNYTWSAEPPIISSMIALSVTDPEKIAGKAIVSACRNQYGTATTMGNFSWNEKGVPTNCMANSSGYMTSSSSDICSKYMSILPGSHLHGGNICVGSDEKSWVNNVDPIVSSSVKDACTAPVPSGAAVSCPSSSMSTPSSTSYTPPPGGSSTYQSCLSGQYWNGSSCVANMSPEQGCASAGGTWNTSTYYCQMPGMSTGSTYAISTTGSCMYGGTYPNCNPSMPSTTSGSTMTPDQGCKNTYGAAASWNGTKCIGGTSPTASIIDVFRFWFSRP